MMVDDHPVKGTPERLSRSFDFIFGPFFSQTVLNLKMTSPGCRRTTGTVKWYRNLAIGPGENVCPSVELV